MGGNHVLHLPTQKEAFIQKEVEMTDVQYDYYKAYCLTLEDATREKILSMSTEVGSRENAEQTVVEYRSGELMNYLEYCSYSFQKYID